jgi:dipeptidyl aminopeptidase/acylaminoacyl peptidase
MTDPSRLLSLFLLIITAPVSHAQGVDLQTVTDALDMDGKFVLTSADIHILTYDFDHDGEKVEAIIFRPGKDARYPGLLMIPGFSRTARDYIPQGIRFAREGFACVAVTQRGFGKSTGKADFVGPKTLAALEAALNKFKQESFVDSARLGVFGYSRGAMAASLLATQRTDLKAVVLAAGIYDFKKAYVEITLTGIRENMEAEAGLTPAAVAERSSLLRMDKLICPVLILHGEKDVNAPVSQAKQLQQRLIELKKDHEIKLFPDRDHNLGMQNLSTASIDFLKRKLKP